MKFTISGTTIAVVCLMAFASASLSARASSFKKVGAGDSIYTLLRQNGFSDTERNMALSESPVPKGFTLAPGDTYMVDGDGAKKKIEVYFFDNFFNQAFVFWKSKGEVGASTRKDFLRAELVSATGKISGSVVQSIQDVVRDEQLPYRFMDAFVLDFNIQKDVQKGATFRIDYQKLYLGKQFVRMGQVLRAELFIKGRKVLREFKATADGGVFVDPNDNHVDRPFFAPVDVIRVSSLFQTHRFHPVRRRRVAHLGIDFELPEGEKIYAVDTGTVIRTGRNRAAGNFVVLRHQGGLESYYNHMSRLSGQIYLGARVQPGTILGFIGCTGYCTKPHLHFAIKRGGRFVDPSRYLKRYAFNQRQTGMKLASLKFRQ
jgi:murein DD-endopeptidase MepM/ murein hydrolase activator NlpD